MGIWVHGALEPSAHDLLQIFTSLNRIFEITSSLMERFQLEAPLRIGAGVNTGQAPLGNIGSGLSAYYTAVSEAVNLAFRIESATRALGCDLALGETTHRALGRFMPAPLPFTLRQVFLKGYDEPVHVFAGTCSEMLGLIDSLRTVSLVSPPLQPE
jgi:adenylate cyclase